MTTRRGFTLLEVLVASALGAVLMAGLWYAYRDYARLFEKGQAKVERAQLARALLDQLADDLRSAIPDAGAEAGGPGGARRFALFGSPQSLQIDVLQLTPASLELPRRDEGAQVAFRSAKGASAQLPDIASFAERKATISSAAERQAPELHSVRYAYRSRATRANRAAGAAKDGDRQAEPATEEVEGLVRQELDWETPAESPTVLQRPRSARQRAVAAGDGESAATAASEEIQGGSLTVVPDVAGVAFRYFDGAAWTDQWNSLDRKSLPVAVEIVLRLKPPAGEEPAVDENRPAEDEPAPAGDAQDIADLLGESDVRTEHVQRMLVHLPTATLPHGVRRERPGAKPIEAERPAPLPPRPAPVAVPRPSVPTAAPLPAADRWMRSGP